MAILTSQTPPAVPENVGLRRAAGEAAGPARSRFLTGFDASGEAIPLHVVESVAGDTPEEIVLVLPFTSGHSRQMRPWAETIGARGIDSVIIDPPGHGRSGGERGTFDVVHLMRTLQSLTDYYAARFPTARLHLVGSSWGGDLALLFVLWECHQRAATGRPCRIRSVIAQAAITPWQREVFKRFRPGIAVLFDPMGTSARLARLALGPRIKVSRMFRADELYASRAHRRRYAADPLVLRTYDTESYLGYLTYLPPGEPERLAVPVLLVQGEHDRLVSPEYARLVYESLRERNPQTTLRLMPGGHALFEEQTDELAATALEWWGSIADRKPLSA